MERMMQSSSEIEINPESGWFYDADPGGNFTLLIPTEDSDSSSCRELYARLMKSFTHFEQGGFITKPRKENSVARLQMAGAEFCGNAGRASAAALVQDMLSERRMSKLARYDLIETSFGEDSSRIFTFQFEISGAEDLVYATVEISKKITSRISMPTVSKDRIVLGQEIRVPDTSTTIVGDAVHLPGISHIVFRSNGTRAPGDDARESLLLSGDLDRELGRKVIGVLRELPRLKDAFDIGLLFIDESHAATRLTPFVWVREIDSFVAETSCGSGSLAVALTYCQREGVSNSAYTRIITQPSKFELTIRLTPLADGYQSSLEGEVFRISRVLA